ncbi:sulfite exporter TauE/SafE family protein [Phaeovulum sp.]|uniref:sulfite exporter TauE/SafE family protein n=1 Tax=Phaeovulum sp. TaxID=2934796 RepID=UPI0035650804
MTLGDYSLYFGLTLVLSTLFAIGGVGSAIALVPSLSMAGIAFDLARALGLFVNTAATAAASVTHFRRGTLDVRFALPLVGSILVATPIGAWSSQFVAHGVLEAILTAFLITASILLLIPRRPTLVHSDSVWPLLAIGAGVGVISGMLGVGGGSLLMPALILLGHDAKKAARAIGFVIPFSTAGAFLTYLSFTQMNWPLLAVVAVAAILGGYLGATILHRGLNEAQVKKLIALLLLALAGKMIWGFWA